MAAEPLMLTVPEAADRLRISRTRVYELILSGELRSLKLGRVRRIPMSALEEFIAERLNETGGDAA